jgi:adenine-specific DNA-methyltransferase
MSQENYINNNLIAYIGNKKRLIDLLKKSIKKVINNKNTNLKFLDLFAGTGVVSRLAKSLGFEVFSNDWEYYSYIINKTFIELNSDFLNSSFKKLGGVDNVLNILNSLNEPEEKDKYISKYYCPENDDNIDLKNERIFYTSYNGLKIDAIRAQIDKWYNTGFIDKTEENFLIALLLYEVSTRSNTSGVFKGFHRGFGGSNGDALSRILKPVHLKKPDLINGNPCHVSKEDAVSLSEVLKETKFDIAYLDPPYNQHQYGSNYHLLNTIALNDKPRVNKNIYINGKKTDKSAIRKDWVKTKSTFCIRKNAKEDFEKIIENLNADHILISYSTDGIIDFKDMLEILSKKGKLDIELSEYVKFRGGRQSLTSEVKNIEFVLIVNTNEEGSREDIDKIYKILLSNKIKLILKKTINPLRLETIGYELLKTTKNSENIFQKKYDNRIVLLKINNNRVVDHNIDKLNLLEDSLEIIKRLNDDFEYITNLTREDEVYLTIDEIIKKYKDNLYKEALNLFKEIPYYISKFNNKKAYLSSLKSIKSVLDLIIQTIDMWKTINLINLGCFKRFEKVIFIKLNHTITDELVYKYSSPNAEKSDYLENVILYKKQISNLYEFIIKEFQRNKTESIKDKKTLIIKKHMADSTARMHAC